MGGHLVALRRGPVIAKRLLGSGHRFFVIGIAGERLAVRVGFGNGVKDWLSSIAMSSRPISQCASAGPSGYHSRSEIC